MQRRRVGSSGLEVSRIGLGTLTWGADTDLDAATAQLTAFVDAGGSLVETADGYGDGLAQETLGAVLAASVPREYLVIAGRATLPGGPLGDSAARGALLTGLDATLKRLGTDHLDLWQLPAWDAGVPLDETLSAVQVAVLSGKARYAGLVAPRGWQLATVAERGRALGAITVPVSAQVEYSLLARDVEAELVPAAVHHGVGLLAWAPLGRGVLTGKYADGTPADSRGASATLAPYVEARRNERSARIVQAVLTAADGLGTSPLAVALAWVRDLPGVASAVVGARDAAQLAASMATESVTLPAEIRAALDDVSTPG
ncbi:aldo/keto reductase [Pseudonocardia sp. KRD-184]|uniref:Aldo/keto reductase n=1 Tax=Pseudonocardia oceani TaxID=2792013 RepID=A0ABS6UD61_9PSEU|nr:aldo/keto reductase [Pseudonocardia oceani]MBW0091670.1 aldo/keto reductase [Pseudonocardia oceani]MBW0097146.1 aldo/keto reductase [Pseudonocardia oceani]MBW0110663.1 aldo/keto reductase [Pseudonocardia oceani]MBW0124002.1 aldo/keto reductase [Pseudonocardia oceani]MBW0130175.1 aldo/keto reductase [Pseudonocardia oceani]